MWNTKSHVHVITGKESLLTGAYCIRFHICIAQLNISTILYVSAAPTVGFLNSVFPWVIPLSVLTWSLSCISFSLWLQEVIKSNNLSVIYCSFCENMSHSCNEHFFLSAKHKQLQRVPIWHIRWQGNCAFLCFENTVMCKWVQIGLIQGV